MWTNSSNDEFDVEDDEDEHKDKAVEEVILTPHRLSSARGPKKERSLTRGCARRIQRCRLCRVVGHSKRLCKGPLNWYVMG